MFIRHGTGFKSQFIFPGTAASIVDSPFHSQRLRFGELIFQRSIAIF